MEQKFGSIEAHFELGIDADGSSGYGTRSSSAPSGDLVPVERSPGPGHNRHPRSTLGLAWTRASRRSCHERSLPDEEQARTPVLLRLDASSTAATGGDAGMDRPTRSRTPTRNAACSTCTWTRPARPRVGRHRGLHSPPRAGHAADRWAHDPERAVASRSRRATHRRRFRDGRGERRGVRPGHGRGLESSPRQSGLFRLRGDQPRLRAIASRYSYRYSAGPPGGPLLAPSANSRKSRSSADWRSGSPARHS